MNNKFKIGYVGLGKMGFNMVERLIEHGHEIVANSAGHASVDRAVAIGATPAYTISELVEKLESPRLIWLMVPNDAMGGVVANLIPLLDKGDTVIDGGNTKYTETKKRALLFAEKGINFMDVGVSGGPSGARNGACLMIGGDKAMFDKYESLFQDISAPGAYGHFGTHGAGHFVKMVHNGIEYGMMQAIGEGFEILKKSEFNPNLEKVAEVYNNKSVIESRLVGWLVSGYKQYGTDLESITGTVAHTGEGMWTVEAGKELGVPTPIIEGSFKFREESTNNPSYIGQVLSVMRNMFGGHEAKK